MQRTSSPPAALLSLAIGLTIMAIGCSHAAPKPEAAPPPPPEAAAAAPDTSTLSGRLQKLGQEIEAIPENTARRMGPELERIEELRDHLDARLRKEGQVVGEKIKGAVETLEDDLRVLRSRMSAPPRAEETDEPEAETADE